MSHIGIAINIWRDTAGTGGGNSWILAPGGVVATLDIDFVNNRAWNSPAFVTIPSLLTCTRATPPLATYTNASGGIQYFAPNTLRYGTNGLLVEEARTNSLLQSQTFGTTWGTNNASISSDALIAPDGTLTADKLVENTANNTHTISQSFVAGAASSWSYSVYAHAGERTRIAIFMTDNAVASIEAGVDLSTGTITAQPVNAGNWTSTSAAIQALANGWYRITLSGSLSTGATLGCFIFLENAAGATTYLGDGVSGLYLWGGQLESAIFPTSYIPTTTTSVTRAADLITPAAGVLNAIKGSAGSIYSQMGTISFGPVSPNTVAARNDTDSRYIYFATTGELRTFNGAALLGTTNQYSGAGGTKGAVAFDASGRAVCLAAGTVFTDANAFSTVTDNSYLGARNTPQDFMNGYLKRFTLWNSRLSNANMQLVTT